jgi:hypothetical protein
MPEFNHGEEMYFGTRFNVSRIYRVKDQFLKLIGFVEGIEKKTRTGSENIIIISVTWLPCWIIFCFSSQNERHLFLTFIYPT